MSELLSDPFALADFLVAHRICALYFSAPDCAVCDVLKPKLIEMLVQEFLIGKEESRAKAQRRQEKKNPQDPRRNRQLSDLVNGRKTVARRETMSTRKRE